jgi:cell division protein ZapA
MPNLVPSCLEGRFGVMENIQVSIYGQVYSIKGQDDPAYIRELAAFIDSKMNEVHKGTGTGDPHRVAILTALMITDELFRLRKQYGVLVKDADNAVGRLLELTEIVEKKP